MKKSVKEISWGWESISAINSFNTVNTENIIKVATAFRVFQSQQGRFSLSATTFRVF